MTSSLRRDPNRSRTLAEIYCQQQREKTLGRLIAEVEIAGARKGAQQAEQAAERFACLIQSHHARASR